MLIPTVLTICTGVAYSAEQFVQRRVDGAEGVGLDIATTVGVVIGVGAFIVWIMRDRQAMDARVTKGESERAQMLAAIKESNEVSSKRTRIILQRLDHERSRRKAGERVLSNVAQHVGVKPVDLNDSGHDSLAGADSVDLLDLEGA